MDILRYFLWPNPGGSSYDNPKVLLLAGVCAACILGSLFVRFWRKKRSSVTKRLSRSWSAALLWFGVAGAVLLVSRVEQISYLSMRLWWVVWILALLLYGAFQLRNFRTRFYQKLPSAVQQDARDKYLPRRKKRR